MQLRMINGINVPLKMLIFLLWSNMALLSGCATLSRTQVPAGTLRTAQVLDVFTGEQFRSAGKPYEEAVASGFNDEDFGDGRFIGLYMMRDQFGGGSFVAAHVPVGIKVEVGDIVEIRSGKGPPQPIYNSVTKVVVRNERIEPYFDDRRWEVGYKIVGQGMSMTEYVLSGQSVNNWQELVTVISLYGRQRDMTSEQFMGALKEIMIKRCPNVFWEVIQRQPDEILFEWRVAGCKGAEDQHEIKRLISGKTAIHHIAYTIKKPKMSLEQKNQWVQLLTAAEIKSGTEK